MLSGISSAASNLKKTPTKLPSGDIPKDEEELTPQEALLNAIQTGVTLKKTPKKSSGDIPKDEEELTPQEAMKKAITSGNFKLKSVNKSSYNTVNNSSTMKFPVPDWKRLYDYLFDLQKDNKIEPNDKTIVNKFINEMNDYNRRRGNGISRRWSSQRSNVQCT